MTQDFRIGWFHFIRNYYTPLFRKDIIFSDAVTTLFHLSIVSDVETHFIPRNIPKIPAQRLFFHYAIVFLSIRRRIDMTLGMISKEITDGMEIVPVEKFSQVEKIAFVK